MRVRVLENAAGVAAAAADIVAAVVHTVTEAVLGLPTGQTAVPFYDELARRHETGELDLRRVTAFNIDELVIPSEHPASFRSFMERFAYSRTGLDPERCEIPDSSAASVAECRRYDRAIATAGGFDLAVLGVGEEGHIAYNLPGQLADETHVVRLPDRLADRLGLGAEHLPLRAITIGMAPLRQARRLVLMATGAEKKAAIEVLLEGPEDPVWPCTLLRRHPAFDVLVDLGATPPSASGSNDQGGD